LDILIDCSAEPSVLVGTKSAEARFVFRNNLEGSVNCFEFARERKLAVLFLSTSRVYPYDILNQATFQEETTRFELAVPQSGLSSQGVSESFPLSGVRSLYGSTKLSCEFLLQEYANQYDMPAIINRCGVIAGPWQLGKVDQGVFTYWIANHYFNKPLRYIGFGGQGKQVRDLLHIDDLADLVEKQLVQLHKFRGQVFNVGGGRSSHLSLQETTMLCREITGNSIPIMPDPSTRPADLSWYISDNKQASETFDWKPKRSAHTILTDTYKWLVRHEADFRNVFTA
jgi:CDP-paratose 2-epimerase